jgi:hypothetical protein
MTRRIACGLAVVLLVGAAPPPAVVRLNTGDPANLIEARAELDAGATRLSGEVKLSLTVEGPGPLSVTVPKPFLTKSGVWRVREDGLPLREVLLGGRERWAQTYYLSPLVPGEPKVSLGPLTVRAGGGNDLNITWEEDKLPAVRVTTAIESASVDALRPPTEIEPLPPEPPVEDHSAGWLFAIVPGLLAASALLLLFARRKKTSPAPRDAAWALRELAASDLTADRCAVVLRQYAAFRFAVPASFQTTSELAAALGAENRLPADAVADWRALLEECDAARFSGTAASVAGLADRARALVEEAEKTKGFTTEGTESTEKTDKQV